MKSIILKNRLKFLYSYSKQSLAPAVSTVGFSFFIKEGRNRLSWIMLDTFSMALLTGWKENK